uniref:Uncharacterized protein n=1 Tax=Manihot esculenta TaxID=3983 RepID=A0A2C9VJR0_MANES
MHRRIPLCPYIVVYGFKVTMKHFNCYPRIHSYDNKVIQKKKTLDIQRLSKHNISSAVI